MLHYSVPMIPNAFAWWMTGDVSRILIALFVGPSGNGLYAIANKLPAMMFTLFGLFQNAWQISSVRISKEKEMEKIYSFTFHFIVVSMFFVATVVVAISKIFMTFYVSRAFFSAWEFVPSLLLTAIFSNISVSTLFSCKYDLFPTLIISSFTVVSIPLET